jgi:hypothetical protein
VCACARAQVAYTHFMSTEAARRDLGYRPVVRAEDALARMARVYSAKVRPLGRRCLVGGAWLVTLLWVLWVLWVLLGALWRALP